MRGWLSGAALPLAAVSVSLAACSVSVDAGDDKGVAGSGSAGARDYAVSGFTAVALTGSDDVEVRMGPAFAVHATGPEQTLDRLKIERDGDTLRVGRKNTIGFNWGGGKRAKIVVTMPAIRAATLTGSGDLTVDRATGDTLKVSATGSGTLDFAAIEVKHADFSLTGSGNIAAKGHAAALAMDVAGSGDIDARGLTAEGATVSVMGSGNVAATVNGAADVTVMGSGDVDLGPNARCRTTKTGSGSVTCGR